MKSYYSNEPSFFSGVHQPGQFDAQAQNNSALVESAFREEEHKKQDTVVDARRERLRAAGRKGAAARTHESRVNGGKKAAQTRGFESLSAAGRKGALTRLRAGRFNNTAKRAAEKYSYSKVSVTRREVSPAPEENEQE
jgi:hypothetical protein